MSKDSIDDLIARTQQRIDRLEALEKGAIAPKGSLTSRMSMHFSKHGSHITNALLAGCVFAVAWGQLQQKYQHQGELEQREKEIRQLRADKRRLEDRVGLLEHNIEQLGEDVRQELATGGSRLSPVAQRLRQLLNGDAEPHIHGSSSATGTLPDASKPSRMI